MQTPKSPNSGLLILDFAKSVHEDPQKHQLVNLLLSVNGTIMVVKDNKEKFELLSSKISNGALNSTSKSSSRIVAIKKNPNFI